MFRIVISNEDERNSILNSPCCFCSNKLCPAAIVFHEGNMSATKFSQIRPPWCLWMCTRFSTMVSISAKLHDSDTWCMHKNEQKIKKRKKQYMENVRMEDDGEKENEELNKHDGTGRRRIWTM